MTSWANEQAFENFLASQATKNNQRISPISASHVANFANGQFTMGGTNSLMQSSIKQLTRIGGHSVCLYYQSVQSPGEQNLSGDGSNISIRASIVDNSGTRFYPAFTRDGNRDAIITPNGGIGRLYVPGFEVPGGATPWFVRTRAICGTGGAFPQNTITNGTDEAPFGPTTGTTDSTLSGPFTGGSSNAIAPNMVSYIPYVPQPCVAVVGDSISAGKFDPNTLSGLTTNAGGWALRALSLDGVTGRLLPGIPNVNMSNESENCVNWGDPFKRRTRMQLITEAGATSAFVMLCTNDMGQTLATNQANLLSVWSTLSNRGIRVFGFTIPPQSSSSDNFATQANQTVASAAQRIPLNQWIRDGAPIINGAAAQVGSSLAIRAGAPGHPAFMMSDAGGISSGIESTLDGGKWTTNGAANGFSQDGIHPSPAGYALIAQYVATHVVPFII